MFSLEDLITPVTRQEVETSIYDVLGIVGTNTTSWKTGAVARTIIVGVSLFLSAMSSLMAQIARSGFLELSEGNWLTLVAYYVFGVTRIEATFASGQLTLTNSGGGNYIVDADDLVVSNSSSGKTYRNISGFTLPPLGTLTIDVRADEAGVESTSNAGDIDTLETSLLGVTCSNATTLIGTDEEADPVLRTRCYEKLGSLSPMGPWDAYSYAARNAKRLDGSSVGVTRVRMTKDGFGNVNTYVATASGGITGTANNPATDLGAVNEAIQQLAAPLAVTANTFSAIAVPIPITYEVWMYNTSGLTEDQIKAAIAARLTTFMSTQPIGGNVIGSDPGKVFADAIKTVIGAVVPQIFHVVVTLPASDTVLAINQVPAVGTLLPTINQVAPGDGGL